MILAWAGVGALIGVVGAIAVRVGPWWAAGLVHYAVPYVFVLAVIGATAPRLRAAASRALGCFVVFVVAYYAVVAVQFGAIPFRYAMAWFIAALTVCPIAAAIMRWAPGHRGVIPAFIAAAAGAVALSDGSVGNLVRVALGRLDPQEVQPATIVTAAVGLFVALTVVLLLTRTRRTRVTAVVLLVPLAAVSTYVGWVVHFGTGPYL